MLSGCFCSFPAHRDFPAPQMRTGEWSRCCDPMFCCYHRHRKYSGDSKGVNQIALLQNTNSHWGKGKYLCPAVSTGVGLLGCQSISDEQLCMELPPLCQGSALQSTWLALLSVRVTWSALIFFSCKPLPRSQSQQLHFQAKFLVNLW